MEKVRTLERTGILDRKQTVALTKFVVLLVVATLLPFLKQQLIVGPLVNTVLFVSAALLGPQAALMVGLVPSLVSISVGLLPPVLAPMIPFIMVSNAILIMVFSQLRTKNQWLGVVVASVLKFVFLASVSNIVINLLLNKAVAHNVSLMMSWLQLVTALVGGAIAILFLSLVKKKTR